MNELTEQEKLARLVRAGNPDAEQYDSADLLTQGLLKELGRPNPQVIAQVEQEIVASGDELDYAPIGSFSGTGTTVHKHAAEPQRDVKLISTLKRVHGGLIDVFERSGLNSGVEGNLVDLIDTTGACLNYLGETTAKFEPLRHLSGLQAPNMVKNANKVVETTMSCYKIGSIEGHQISDDGSEIQIVFSGKYRNIEYKAFGVVTASSWEGSEAIDYIYTPGSGKLSVKSFECGKWIDKSDKYEVKWTLEEKDLNLEEKAQENPNNSTVEREIVASEKISEEKEEVFTPTSNNDFDDDEEIGDFPISDE